MIKNLSIVFSIFLIAGIIIPAYAQTSTDHVVINEVDINPFGDDFIIYFRMGGTLQSY